MAALRRYLAVLTAKGLRWGLAKIAPLTGLEGETSSTSGHQNVYLFVAINGAGLGHLTRCLAVAKKLQKLDPSAHIVFFTTSLGMVIVHRFGFRCFHIPPFDQIQGSFVDSKKWNQLFENHLLEIIGLYSPRCLIFDGTYAYGGLQNVIKQRSDLQCVWIRRAGAASQHDEAIKAQSRLFRHVVVPGDLAVQTLSSAPADNKINVPPIVLLESDEVLSRTHAREFLSLGLQDKVVYVQLGAGNINELSKLEEFVLSVLEQVEGLTVLISDSPIALEGTDSVSKFRRISSYPNARYFKAFDFAVVAAGYNTVNECVAGGLPAVFIPNTNTKSDDQVARANRAAAWDGWYVWDGESPQEFKQMVNQLAHRTEVPTTRELSFNGAEVAAELILQLPTKT